MSYMRYTDAALYHGSARNKRDMVTVETILLRETDKAYFVDTGEVDGKGKPIGVFVPKSLCEFLDGELHLPEWLAKEKGLV